jgi:polar amino acid transport system substrate-binding protein
MLKTLLKTGLAALAAAILFAPISEARPLDEIIKSGKIKIGVHPNGKPLSEVSPDGTWQGFDIDIGTKIADMLGVEPEWVPQETPQRVPNLISDRTDFSLGGLTRTAERMKVISYTVPLHTESMAVLYTDKTEGKLGMVKSWKDFDREDVTVVNCRGCWPEEWRRNNMAKTKALLVDGAADMVRSLAIGRADVIVENLDFFMAFTENYPNVKWIVNPDIIQTAYCGVGVKQGNYALRDWLNTALYDLQVRNFHNEAWEKHFGSPQVVPVVAQPYW